MRMMKSATNEERMYAIYVKKMNPMSVNQQVKSTTVNAVMGLLQL